MPREFQIYAVCYSALLLVCMLIGCLLVRRNWPYWYRLLVILICVTVLAEEAALYSIRHGINHFRWYNVWVFLETMTLLFIISRESTQPAVRRLHMILMIILPPGAAACFLLLPGKYGVFIYAVVFYCLLELIAACAMLIDLLMRTTDRPPFSQPMFWLAAGLLFYACIFTVILSVGNFFPHILFSHYIYFSIAANTFLYGGFVGCWFALRREERRKARSCV